MSNIMSDTKCKGPDAEKAPFFVGVTGYTELTPEEIEPLKKRLRQLFRFLRTGLPDAACEEDQVEIESQQDETATGLELFVRDLVLDGNDDSRRSSYHAALSGWNGLGKNTPIIVLTSLAPGVDTLVANLVLDEFSDDEFYLLCPLPFPPHIYAGSNTFVAVTEDGQPDLKKSLKRQQDFLRLLKRMGAIPEGGLVDKANGTKDLPEELVQALQEVAPERFFPVCLRSDTKLDPAAQEARWLADCYSKTSKRRDKRYYAAGEYMTVSAHLMVAVWDGRREQSDYGASAIVEARLAGPQHGVLPSTTGLGMAHGGPVWHLLAHRPPGTSATGPESCAQDQLAGQPLPRLRILHPFAIAGRDCPRSSIIGAGQAKNMELQTERLQQLARIGESLANYNRKKLGDAQTRERQYRQLLGEPAALRPDFPDLLAGKFPAPLESNRESFAKMLRKVSDAHFRSSGLADSFQRQLKRTLAVLFWVTLLSAISLHFCTHWHVRHSEEVSTEPSTSHDHDQEDEGEEEHLKPWQVGFGCGALFLACAAGGFFALQRSRKLGPQAYDNRAISEGLRIQFFWNLAGLGTSVSANYMSRHRSELDWIRGVIRATSTPYYRWTKAFSALSRREQLRAFRVVQAGWVRGQLRYFRKSTHRYDHLLHLWHKFGGVVALAGGLTFFKLIGRGSWPSVAWLVEHACHWWMAALLLAVAGCISCYFGALSELHHYAAETLKHAKEAWNRQGAGWRAWLMRVGCWLLVWLESVLGFIFELVNILVPSTSQSVMSHTSFVRRLVHGVLAFVAYLPLALMTACGVITLCGSISLNAEHLSIKIPEALDLSIIAASVLLVGGALAVAWPEKNLHSELAYQYNTMAGLFEAADARLEKELADFHKAIQDLDEDAQRRSVNRVQALLFELGQEALDENAEWLLLHRARPLEPVMAG